MADRFWVGGTGNWSDNVNHWSATSGGAPGASLPTSVDNVYFNALSFTSAGQTITVDVTANCLDMDWVGTTNNPIISGTAAINIFGSLTLVPGLTINHSGNKNFTSTSAGRTVTTSGYTLLGSIQFTGVGGGWTLQDDVTIANNYNFTFTSGSLNTNNKSISCGIFFISSSSTRTISLGSSTINCNLFTATTTTGLTFNVGTSQINILGNSVTFTGGGLTFYSVTFIGNSITVTGDNTFNILTITADKTIKLTSGTIQTVSNLFANGTNSSPITIQSTTAGSAATINKLNSSATVRYCSIKDISSAGAAVFYALHSTNVSGNTGLSFVSQILTGQIKFNGSVMSLYWTDANGVLQKISG